MPSAEVYGDATTLDAERLIDLLQAMEKFVAVRDTGDGTAFKARGAAPGCCGWRPCQERF